MEAERRRLFRNGALLLLLSGVIGLVVASPVPHPEKWMAMHVSGLMVGLLLIGAGALWAELRLTDSARAWAARLLLTASWAGVALNLFAAVVNAPGPASTPGRQFDAPWQQAVFVAILVVVVPSTLGGLVLICRGLRGK